MALYQIGTRDGCLKIWQLDEVTKNPIGNLLSVSNALLAADVEVVITPDSSFRVEPNLRCRL